VAFQRGIPFQYGKTVSYVPAGLDSGAVVREPQNTLATLENNPLFTQGMYGELKHFCDQALQGRPTVRGSLEFARDVMQAYEAALLSDGCRVAL
jgi:hypothetical protein